MSRIFEVKMKYQVTELITVEADSPRDALAKAREMLAEGTTARRIVDDESDYAEFVDMSLVEQ